MFNGSSIPGKLLVPAVTFFYFVTKPQQAFLINPVIVLGERSMNTSST